jgi:hypothetical protein
MADPELASGDDRRKGRTTRLVTFGGLLVGLIAGVVGLLFQVDPKLQPCLGGSGGAFTGTVVFPHVGYRQYLTELGRTAAEVAQVPDDSGVDVSFSYHTDNLRGRTLTVRWSLLTIEPDGTLGPVVAGDDRLIATTINQDQCSQTTSWQLFAPIPSGRARYQVVLELDGDQGYTSRIALTQTAIFRS